MISYREAFDKAQEINGQLLCTDFTPMRYVHVTTDEGLRADIPPARAMKCEDWFFVFAEHHAVQVFHEGDIEAIYEYAVTTGQYEIMNANKFKPKKRKKK